MEESNTQTKQDSGQPMSRSNSMDSLCSTSTVGEKRKNCDIEDVETTECESAFQTITRKGKRRKQNNGTSATHDHTNQQNQDSNNRRPTSVVVKSTTLSNNQLLQTQLHRVCRQQKAELKHDGRTNWRIKCPNSTAKNLVREFLTTNKIEHHTFSDGVDKNKRVMVKGIKPALYEAGELETIIKTEWGIKPLRIIPFTSISIYMIVIFPPETKLAEIYKKNKLDVCIIKCEKYHTKGNRAPQCMKCLAFGHIATNCEHEEVEPAIIIDDKRTCTLFRSEGHSGKDRICPIREEQMKKAIGKRTKQTPITKLQPREAKTTAPTLNDTNFPRMKMPNKEDQTNNAPCERLEGNQPTLAQIAGRKQNINNHRDVLELNANQARPPNLSQRNPTFNYQIPTKLMVTEVIVMAYDGEIDISHMNAIYTLIDELDKESKIKHTLGGLVGAARIVLNRLWVSLQNS